MARFTAKLTLLLAAFSLLVGGCSDDKKQSATRRAGLRGDNVLLITVDTTRADRIGCYGYKPAQTPVMDALASRGVLFEKAYSQVPLTLPSHASIMTGRYPREHGVRDNGRARLSTQYPTLSTIFQKNGYRTGGFIASYVLIRKFGLAQGFDTFVDSMWLSGVSGSSGSGEKKRLEVQLPGNIVTDRALKWLGKSSDAPFFCWVHYYDPHDPYEPIPAFANVGMAPYDGEISFMDSQIGRLIGFLEKKKIRDDTLIVIIGDHGESFGEHGEHGHTNFTYDTNLHVPFIVVHPHATARGTRSDVIVETVDVFPTILDLFGWEAPASLTSRSLSPVLKGGRLPDAEAYGETLYVRNGFGWAEQRSLTTRDWKFISSTTPELYDRQKDPGEKNNIIGANPRIAADLHARLVARLDAMVPGKAEKTDISDAARESLGDLGYVDVGKVMDGDSEQFLTADLIDPKTMTDALTDAQTAQKLMDKAKTPADYRRPIEILERVTKAIPESLVFHGTLGKAYQGAEDFDRSVVAFANAVKVDPTQAGTHLLLARSLMKVNRKAEAVAEFKVAIDLDGAGAVTRAQYGEALEGLGQRDEAIKQYQKAVQLSPTMWNVHDRLCTLLQGTTAFPQAVRQFESAVQKHSGDSFAHFSIGSVFLGMAEWSRAIPHLEAAINLDPQDGKSIINLGIALREVGRIADARRLLEQAVAIESVAPEAFYNLGILEAKRGRLDKAVQLYEKAIALKPSFVAAVTELAMFYTQQKKIPDAIRILRAGAKASPNEVQVLNALGQLLATSSTASTRNGKEAVALLERAAELTGRADMLVLANLAAAFAESGDFAKARAIAEESLALPASAGQADLPDRIREQLGLYMQGTPFHNSKL
jgi:arylsulfatase A-like enzyme/tetratricopeptide (TPR) repeat protein